MSTELTFVKNASLTLHTTAIRNAILKYFRGLAHPQKEYFFNLFLDALLTQDEGDVRLEQLFDALFSDDAPFV